PTHALPSTRAVTHTGGGLATNSTTNSHNATVTLTTGGTSYVLSRSVFDRAGRTSASATDNTAITRYTYDGANRQLTMTDPLGNVVQNTYDGNSNLVASTRIDKCTIVDDGTFLYYYDALNRLVHINTKSTGFNLAWYLYDALGRRVQKNVVTTGPNYYFYDGQQIIDQRTNFITALRQFVWGQYIDELIQMQT